MKILSKPLLALGGGVFLVFVPGMVPMPLVDTIAGPFSATYDNRGLGSPEDVGETQDGFRLRWRHNKMPITGSAYADLVVDSIFRGMEVYLSFITIQADNVFFDDDLSNAATPYAYTGNLGVIGMLDVGSLNTGTVVMTAVSDTSAENSPATLTTTNAIIREDFDCEALMASRLRAIPMEFRLYPYLVTGSTVGFFTYT